MFNKVVVANRGAVAARVLRALAEMHVPSVAVYSEADAGAPYLGDGERTYGNRPAPARESYLNQDVLIEVLRRWGADGLHPGYGFLSENAAFAQRVIDAGARFIGPSPRWIEAMGHKTRARALAAKSGMPMPQGSEVLPADPRRFSRRRERYRLSRARRAGGGGGGFGMLLADGYHTDCAEWSNAPRSWRARGFGNADGHLERLIERPRHVEFQVLGVHRRRRASLTSATARAAPESESDRGGRGPRFPERAHFDAAWRTTSRDRA